MLQIILSYCRYIPFVPLLLLAIIGCEKTNSSPPVPPLRPDVYSLVSIGMNIDEASMVLKKNGYTVGDKYIPVKDGDYYQVNVVVSTDRSALETAEYTVMGNDAITGSKKYVVIKASLDSKVISIE